MFLGPHICKNARAMGVRVLLGVLAIPFTAGMGLGQPSWPLDAPWVTRVAVPHGRPPSTSQPAKGRFLIASRNLSDPNFGETVVVLLSAGARGAMGVVINRPTGVRLASALPDVAELRDRPDRVFVGGPVAGNVMVLLIRARTQPAKSELIFGDVYATGNLTALREALARKGKTDRLHAYVGYAGWGPGQLEREIARGDWYVGPAEATTIFDLPPADVWPRLIERFSGAWTRTDTVSGSWSLALETRIRHPEPRTLNPDPKEGTP